MTDTKVESIFTNDTPASLQTLRLVAHDPPEFNRQWLIWSHVELQRAGATPFRASAALFQLCGAGLLRLYPPLKLSAGAEVRVVVTSSLPFAEWPRAFAVELRGERGGTPFELTVPFDTVAL